MPKNGAVVSTKKVYLAGGLRTDWQDVLLSYFKADDSVEFFDPRELQGRNLGEIATQEADWIAESDVVFVYLEATNEVPLGSSFEMGFASALGIPIVLVDEHGTNGSYWLSTFSASTSSDLRTGTLRLARRLREMSGHA